MIHWPWMYTYMKDELSSVSDFAKRLNISVQAVYKQLNGKLKPYLTIVNGKKILQIHALEALRDDTAIQPDASNVLITSLQTQIQLLNEQITDLKEQRQLKDDLIEKLAQQNSLYQAKQLNLSEKSSVAVYWWPFKKKKDSASVV